MRICSHLERQPISYQKDNVLGAHSFSHLEERSPVVLQDRKCTAEGLSMYQIYSDTPLVQEARFLNIDSYGSRLRCSTTREAPGDHSSEHRLSRFKAQAFTQSERTLATIHPDRARSVGRRSPLRPRGSKLIRIRNIFLKDYLTPKAKTQWLV